ncbi:hypothetical protein B0H13DRAFT_1855994 [Mycena leptocephala]|nr:hypothetical protein B0H13DRAFT_1855994 [Mycena leptocephala]
MPSLVVPFPRRMLPHIFHIFVAACVDIECFLFCATGTAVTALESIHSVGPAVQACLSEYAFFFKSLAVLLSSQVNVHITNLQIYLGVSSFDLVLYPFTAKPMCNTAVDELPESCLNFHKYVDPAGTLLGDITNQEAKGISVSQNRNVHRFGGLGFGDGRLVSPNSGLSSGVQFSSFVIPAVLLILLIYGITVDSNL